MLWFRHYIYDRVFAYDPQTGGSWVLDPAGLGWVESLAASDHVHDRDESLDPIDEREARAIAVRLGVDFNTPMPGPGSMRALGAASRLDSTF